MTGPLQVDALERALNEIIRRHEVLRTTFSFVDGAPCRSSRPTAPDPGAGGSEPPPGRRRRGATPGGAGGQPALRSGAGPADPGHPLAWRRPSTSCSSPPTTSSPTAGRPACSCASWPRSTAPSSPGGPRRCRSCPSSTPTSPSGSGSGSRRRGPGGAARLLARQLGGPLPALELPADRPRPRCRPSRGGQPQVRLPAALTAALTDWRQREGATLFMALLAGFEALLDRYTGQDDVVVGTPIANRNRVEIEGLIGFFVNTLVLRADLSGDPHVPRAAAPSPRGVPRRLRPPGPALRAAGRGAAAGARPEPQPALPGHVLTLQNAPGGQLAAAGRRRPRARSRSDTGDGQVRPGSGPAQSRARALRAARSVQHGPVRRGDDRAPAGPLPDPARRRSVADPERRLSALPLLRRPSGASSWTSGARRRAAIPRDAVARTSCFERPGRARRRGRDRRGLRRAARSPTAS